MNFQFRQPILFQPSIFALQFPPSRIFLFCAALGILLAATSISAQNRPSANPKSKSARQPVSPPIGVIPADMTPEAAEVVWLYHHNSTPEGMLQYINNSHTDFKLSVEDVNYLKDIGLPTDIVFAMIRTPQARENIVSLRNREPLWPAPKGVKQERPQPALENIDYRRTQQLEATPDLSTATKTYSPTNTMPKVK
jgi:hypothetical protein